MSSHTIPVSDLAQLHGCNHLVVGWNRQFREFFAQVSYTGGPQRVDRVDECSAPTMASFQAILLRHGVTLPSPVRLALEREYEGAAPNDTVKDWRAG